MGRMIEMAGAIFRAIPDAGIVPVTSHPITGFYPVWPNCTVIPDDIIVPIAQKANIYWYPPGQGIALNQSDWIVNLLADADEYASALTWLNGLQAAKSTPIFNHPHDILKTRRDLISQTLQGMPNLLVPKCVRFELNSPADLDHVFDENGFQFPVLLRPAGSQTGLGLQKIDTQKQWDKVLLTPRLNNIFYMTQYMDYRSQDERYIKLRLTIFGDEFILRHVKFDRQWNVHHSELSYDMADDEMKIIEELQKTDTLQHVVTAIVQNIKLDFWGLDLGYKSIGEPFLFFEGNAAMSMLSSGMRRALPGTLSGRDKKMISQVVRQKLAARIQNPKTWCY